VSRDQKAGDREEKNNAVIAVADRFDRGVADRETMGVVQHDNHQDSDAAQLRDEFVVRQDGLPGLIVGSVPTTQPRECASPPPGGRPFHEKADQLWQGRCASPANVNERITGLRAGVIASVSAVFAKRQIIMRCRSPTSWRKAVTNAAMAIQWWRMLFCTAHPTVQPAIR